MSSDDLSDQNVLDVKKRNLLDTIPIYVGTVLFGATVFFVTINVLVRIAGLDFLTQYTFWAVPFSRYTLIVMTYLGVAIAFRNGENIKIDFIRRRVKKRGSVVYYTLTGFIIMCIAFFGYITVRGAIQSAIATWSSASDLPFINLGIVHLGIAISFLLMMIYLIYDIIDYVQIFRAYLTDQEVGSMKGTLLSEEVEATDQFSEEESDIQSTIGLENSREEKGDQ